MRELERLFSHADRRITQTALAKAEEARKAHNEQAARYFRHTHAQLNLRRLREGIAEAVVSGKPGLIVEEEFDNPNRQLHIASWSPSLAKKSACEPQDRRPVRMPPPEPSPFLPADRLERGGDHWSFAVNAPPKTGQNGPVRARLGPLAVQRRRIDGQDPGYDHHPTCRRQPDSPHHQPNGLYVWNDIFERNVKTFLCTHKIRTYVKLKELIIILST